MAYAKKKDEQKAAPWGRGGTTPGSWSSPPAPRLQLACKNSSRKRNKLQTFIAKLIFGNLPTSSKGPLAGAVVAKPKDGDDGGRRAGQLL